MSDPARSCWFAGVDCEEAERETVLVEFASTNVPCGAYARWRCVIATDDERLVPLCDKHLALIVTEMPQILLEVSAR